MTTSVGNNSHPILTAPVAQPGQQVPPKALTAHAVLVKGQKEVTVLMLLTMDLDIQRNLAHLGAYDMLQELKAMFSKQADVCGPFRIVSRQGASYFVTFTDDFSRYG
ncbi:hypothetical protein Tco_1397750, partial [Tanacetum coccineum]